MNLNICTSMAPQLVGELGQDQIDDAARFCVVEYKTGYAKVVEKFGTTHVLATTRPGVRHYYFLLELKTLEVEYLVQDRAIELMASGLPIKKSGRQVLVWRKPLTASVYASGIARHVFWNILFKKYKVLASDYQQTSQGKEFWQFIASDALDRGHTLCLLYTNTRKHKEFKTKADLAEHQHTIWGASSWFSRMLLVIY